MSFFGGLWSSISDWFISNKSNLSPAQKREVEVLLRQLKNETSNTLNGAMKQNLERVQDIMNQSLTRQQIETDNKFREQERKIHQLEMDLLEVKSKQHSQQKQLSNKIDSVTKNMDKLKVSDKCKKTDEDDKLEKVPEIQNTLHALNEIKNLLHSVKANELNSDDDCGSNIRNKQNRDKIQQSFQGQSNFNAGPNFNYPLGYNTQYSPYSGTVPPHQMHFPNNPGYSPHNPTHSPLNPAHFPQNAGPVPKFIPVLPIRNVDPMPNAVSSNYPPTNPAWADHKSFNSGNPIPPLFPPSYFQNQNNVPNLGNACPTNTAPNASGFVLPDKRDYAKFNERASGVVLPDKRDYAKFNEHASGFVLPDKRDYAKFNERTPEQYNHNKQRGNNRHYGNRGNYRSQANSNKSEDVNFSSDSHETRTNFGNKNERGKNYRGRGRKNNNRSGNFNHRMAANFEKNDGNESDESTVSTASHRTTGSNINYKKHWRPTASITKNNNNNNASNTNQCYGDKGSNDLNQFKFPTKEEAFLRNININMPLKNMVICVGIDEKGETHTVKAGTFSDIYKFQEKYQNARVHTL